MHHTLKPPVLLNGKLLAHTRQQAMQQELATYREQYPRLPRLVVIQVGDDPASTVYVAHKQKACAQVGIDSALIHLTADHDPACLAEAVDTCNADPATDAILIQLPLPPHWKDHAADLLSRIAIDKDVDGFHPYHIGQLAQGQPTVRCCTPYGIMELLDHYHISLSGIHAVVVGASPIVGRPMALELLRAGCTVTICHHLTHPLSLYTQQADLLITAVGQRGLIRGPDVKPGVVVVDVGITRDPDGHLYGDVDHPSVAPKARAITPVPGGVGPMTVTMLLRNTIMLYLQHMQRQSGQSRWR